MDQKLTTDPVTLTFTASEWRQVLSGVVQSATDCEEFMRELRMSPGGSVDTLVMEAAQRVSRAVLELDDVAEVLGEVLARSEPGESTPTLP